MKKRTIMGKITSKCKGGCIEHIETGSLMFLRVSNGDKPLKDISHLMNEHKSLL